MKVWICTNGDGVMATPEEMLVDEGPNFCYFTMTLDHRPDCGWFIPQPKIDADTEGKARRDHPDTAKAAAKTIGNAGTQRRAIYNHIRNAISYGFTDEEIADLTHLSPSSVRPRRVELVEGGHVKDSGERRKTAAGRDAIVWVTT